MLRAQRTRRGDTFASREEGPYTGAECIGIMEGLAGMQHAVISTGCWGKGRVESMKKECKNEKFYKHFSITTTKTYE